MIGVAESHGREDTMRLIGRLPRLPMKKVVYRGVEVEEFDLEEALRVKPQLILMDELAHTNASACAAGNACSGGHALCVR